MIGSILLKKAKKWLIPCCAWQTGRQGQAEHPWLLLPHGSHPSVLSCPLTGRPGQGHSLPPGPAPGWPRSSEARPPQDFLLAWPALPSDASFVLLLLCFGRGCVGFLARLTPRPGVAAAVGQAQAVREPGCTTQVFLKLFLADDGTQIPGALRALTQTSHRSISSCFPTARGASSSPALRPFTTCLLKAAVIISPQGTASI